MAEGIKKISENVTVANRALVITSPTVPDNDAISIGALQSDPAKKGLKLKTSKGVYSSFDAEQILAPLSISTNLLANLCVTEAKLANNSVSYNKLQDNSVGEIKLRDNSVTRNKIKNGEVVQGKLANNSVINSNLLNECVTNSKIASGTIQNDKLYDKTITNAKIADGTIIESCLSQNSVTETKIKDLSISYNKLQNNSVYGDKIKDGAITNSKLGQNAVNTNNILNGAINSDKLASNSVYEWHIADNQILSKHIFDGAVTNNKLSTDSVTTSKIKDRNVTKEKLSIEVLDLIGDPVQYDRDNNVTLRKDLTINGNVEAVGTIRASKIYNAVFMDLAEAYTPAPEECLLPGDIVELRQDGFVYRADSIRKDEEKVIVGVVSNEYAQCFGATEEDLQTNQKVAVGMIGKVHVNVTGPVRIGEYIGACKDGIGVSNKVDLTLQREHIIGKALETNEAHGPKKVLCLIFPN